MSLAALQITVGFLFLSIWAFVGQILIREQ